MGRRASSAENKRFLYPRTFFRTQNVEEEVREEEIDVAFAKSHPRLTVVWAQYEDNGSLGAGNAESEDCVYTGERTKLDFEEDIDRARLFERNEAGNRTFLCRIVACGKSPELPPAARRQDALDEISRPKARPPVGVNHAKETTIEPSRVETNGLS